MNSAALQGISRVPETIPQEKCSLGKKHSQLLRYTVCLLCGIKNDTRDSRSRWGFRNAHLVVLERSDFEPESDSSDI